MVGFVVVLDVGICDGVFVDIDGILLYLIGCLIMLFVDGLCVVF